MDALIVEWKIEQRHAAESAAKAALDAKHDNDSLIVSDSEAELENADEIAAKSLRQKVGGSEPNDPANASQHNDLDVSSLGDAGTGAAMSDGAAQPARCVRHTLVVETGCVLNALRAYVRTHLNANIRVPVGGIGGRSEATTMAERLACVRSTVSRLLRADDVEMFWRRYREVFNAKHRHLWDSLEIGLKEFMLVLKRREKLDRECQQLRQQNVELRHMLQPYALQMGKRV